MKKILSFLLLISLLSVFCMSILQVSAAPSGQAIRTAANFGAMDSAGTYYLDADITLNASYSKDFKGTLDGNGHTITLSGVSSAFNNLVGAKVKNLNVVVEYTSSKTGTFGALANYASGTFENLNASVNFRISGEASSFKGSVGGLIGVINGSSTVSGCSVSGAVSVDTLNGASASAGGLIGRISAAGKVSIIDCTNFVDVTSKQYQMNNGGIFGSVDGKTQTTVSGCINYGTIKGTSGNHSGSAGIAGGVSGANAPEAVFSVSNCANFGAIEDMLSEVKSKGNHHIGGIVGRLYGMADATFYSCVNAGSLRSIGGGWASAGGIIGGTMTFGFNWVGTHAGVTKVKNCVNVGDIVDGEFSGGIIGGALQYNTDGSSLTVELCSNYGSIGASTAAGGIVGLCGKDAFNGLTIKQCYNTGWVSCNTSRCAGILGYYEPTEGGSNNKITTYLERTIDGCVNAGDINCPAGVSAIVGGVQSGSITVQNCVNSGKLNSKIAYQVAPVVSGTIQSSGNATINRCAAGDTYAVTLTEKSINRKVDSLLGLLPADPTELCLLLVYTGVHEASDFTGGWSGFESARDSAAETVCTLPDRETLDTEFDGFVGVIALLVRSNADTAKLEETIEYASQYVEDLPEYTSKSRYNFKNAYLHARIIKLSKSSREVVDSATDTLTKAIDNIEYSASSQDVSALDKAMKKYEDYVPEYYTLSSWKAYKEAYVAAKELMSGIDIPRKELEAVMATMNSAEAGLVPKADALVLQDKLFEVKESYPKEDYTPDSYAVLEDVFAMANTMIASHNIGQQELDECLAAFEGAIAQLKKKSDFGEIDAIIASIIAIKQNDYTPQSWEALVATLERVEQTRKRSSEQGDVSAEQMEALKEELENSISGLVGYAEYSKHDEIIDMFNAIDKGLYTEQSLARVYSVVNRIDLMRAATNTTARSANEALSELKEAIKALEKAEVTPENTDVVKVTEPVSKKGCGAMLGGGSLGALLLLGAAVPPCLRKMGKKRNGWFL